MTAPTTINFTKLEGPVCVGRQRGELLRDALQVDRLDGQLRAAGAANARLH
jgi:hypothetical protein